MSHTPGPWYARDAVVLKKEEEGFKGIADCRTVDVTKEEGKANARLIAVAPELLAICKEIKAFNYIMPIFDDRLEALIARAEGKSQS